MNTFATILYAFGSTSFVHLTALYLLVMYGNVTPGYLGMGGLEIVIVGPVLIGVSLVIFGIFCYRIHRREKRGLPVNTDITRFWLFCVMWVFVGAFVFFLSEHCADVGCPWLPRDFHMSI